MRDKMKTYSDDILHVFNKSIAGYGIFKDFANSQRFIDVLDYYNNKEPHNSFSNFLIAHPDFSCYNLLYNKESSALKFISYCIMPDHYHLLVKGLGDNILSKYISDVENSFSKYFNFRFERKGPLWQSSFKFVRVRTNEQLLHVSRYIHLNPTTSYLVQNPEDWHFSSYKSFISDKFYLDYASEISIRSPSYYQKFVEDQKDYQRTLRMIKKLIFD